MVLIAALMVGTAGGETLRITVYDWAKLAKNDTRTAERELRRIFRESGIEIEWTPGIATAEEASLRSYSEAPPKGHEQEALCHARRDIAFQVLPVTPPGLKYKALGMAHPFAHDGTNVTVYDDRVREAAERHGLGHAIVLAHVIAHEIGHVLLRSGDHSLTGLMAYTWTEREYFWLAARFMYFSAAQSKAMRTTLEGTGCPVAAAVLGSERSDRTRGQR